MAIVADTHVHLYPCYNLDESFRRLQLGLRALGAGRPLVMLTERADCHVYGALATGERCPSGWSVAEAAEAGVLTMTDATGRDLDLVAGRQIVTQERVEILALALVDDVADEQSADDTLEQIQAAGGVPVLSWAPGKWLGPRGRIIARLLKQHEPGQLLLGDTSLRPAIMPEPWLMQRARQRGFGVVHGSDPLPFAGEERMMATYGSRLNGDWDEARPLASLRALLRTPALASKAAGQRCGLFDLVRRLRSNARVRSSAQ